MLPKASLGRTFFPTKDDRNGDNNRDSHFKTLSALLYI